MTHPKIRHDYCMKNKRIYITTTTRLLKMNFLAWQLLKTLPQNVGLDIWATILIILMVPIPIWAATLVVQNETVYINIYMKVKNIFYFYFYFFYFLFFYYIILYIMYMYINIYISRIFPTGG